MLRFSYSAALRARSDDVAARGGYEPGKRSYQWLKLKRDYIDGMGDTFDLVPIGAYMGKGRRAGAYGAYLLGVYAPEAGVYQPICKLGSGLSDEELRPNLFVLQDQDATWHLLRVASDDKIESVRCEDGDKVTVVRAGPP